MMTARTLFSNSVTKEWDMKTQTPRGVPREEGGMFTSVTEASKAKSESTSKDMLSTQLKLFKESQLKLFRESQLASDQQIRKNSRDPC